MVTLKKINMEIHSKIPKKKQVCIFFTFIIKLQ